MIITDVTFVGLRAPVQAPITLSFGSAADRRMGLVLIETDEGLQGIGEAWVNFPAWALCERALTVTEGIKPLLIGENPLEVTRLFHKMVQVLCGYGRQWGALGPIFQAISGAEMALWDIAGKAAGLPVWRLLGGSALAGIPVYASGIGPSNVAEMGRWCAEQGFRAVKLKVGFDIDQDLSNLKALRQAVGPNCRIMVDANQAWSKGQAIAFAELAREQEVFWLEEPVRCGDYASMGEIRRRTGMAVAAGENAYGREEFRVLLEADAVDVVQPDVTKAGGMGEARLACEMALAWGKRYAPHCFGGAVGLAASLHLFAATPGGLYVELDVNPNPLREALIRPPLRARDGFLPLPNGPGWGVELDPAVVNKFRIV